MTDLAKLRDDNSRRWALATLRSSVVPQLDVAAKRLVAPEAKARYQAVEKITGVLWFIIAVIHEREASQRWGANIAQGDPWDKKSVHVPAGRGPFKSWEDAAVDALTNCAPYAARNKDWSPGGALTILEQYNGLGYANKGLPSPYIWSGTDQYVKGKYVADHVYDANAVDKQMGCAALIKRMMIADPSIRFGPVVVGKPTSVPPVPQKKTPAITKARAGAAGGVIVAGGTATAIQNGVSISTVAGVVLVTLIVLGVVWFVVHTIKSQK